MALPFVSLKEFFQSPPKSLQNDNTTFKDIHAAQNSAQVLQQIQEQLDELGFRKLQFLGAGTQALAFIDSNDQVVRVSLDSAFEKQYRPVEPFILQPIAENKISLSVNGAERTALIEVLPRVQLLSRADEDYLELVRKLKRVLRQVGYEINDSGDCKNIGLITVGYKTIPILIDCGNIKKIPGVPLSKAENIKFIYRDWLDGKGEWLQKTPDIIQGVVAGNEARDIESKMDLIRSHEKDDESISFQAKAGLFVDGLYKDDYETVLKRAVARYDNASSDSGISYAQCLKEERARMVEERNARKG